MATVLNLVLQTTIPSLTGFTDSIKEAQTPEGALGRWLITTAGYDTRS